MLVKSTILRLYFVVSLMVVKQTAAFVSTVAIPRQRQRCHRERTFLLHQITEQQLGSFVPLGIATEERENRIVFLEDWTTDPSTSVPFQEAWDQQRLRLAYHIDRLDSSTRKDKDELITAAFLTQEMSENLVHSSYLRRKTSSPDFDPLNGRGVDRVIMLEHSPVYTLGTASTADYILASANDSNVNVVRMDRGGEVTYHGPGQLTVYPIIDLRNYQQDIHWYVRALEEVVISACRYFGLEAYREDDTTGVWIDNHKIAAVGIKCRKWITQHGLAVNVLDSSLPNFEGIVPCGLTGRRVGCLNQFAKYKISMKMFVAAMETSLEEVFCIKLLSAKNSSLKTTSCEL